MSATKTKKQYTVGINPSDKAIITDLMDELTRPGAVKDTVNASEREVVEILVKVATDRRFQAVEVTDPETGETRTETQDLIENAWNELVARDHAEKGVSQIDKLKAREAELLAQIEALKAQAKG